MAFDEFEVGSFVGSLAKASINRKLARALVRLTPQQLMLSEIGLGERPRDAIAVLTGIRILFTAPDGQSFRLSALTPRASAGRAGRP